MPRITRAAVRSNAILEDEPDLAMSIPLPATPQKEREPLGEVVGNVVEEALVVDVVKAEKRGGAKGRKAKGTKKGKKQPKTDYEETVPDVLDDDNPSASSSAVEEACVDLMKPNAGGEISLCSDLNRTFIDASHYLAETYQIPMQDRPTTPQSPAVDVARKHLTPKAHTPRFEPKIHGSEDTNMKAPTDDQEDSFVGTIGSRTPAKMTRIESFDGERNEENTANHSEDSFVEKIVTRSPAKSITRIEDSVEAIDALEDAIEELGESLPAVSVDAQSPVMDKKGSKIVRGQTKATTPKSGLKEKKNATPQSAMKENKSTTPKSVLKENKTATPKPVLKENKMAIPKPALKENKMVTPRLAMKENKTATPKPSLKENIASPKSAMKKLPAGRPSTVKSTPIPPPAKKTPSRASHISSTRASLPAKPARQPSSSTTSTGAKTSTITTTSTAAKPSTTSTATNPPTTTLKRPVSSTHKAPFHPTKSLKPPTRPSFFLPGDAISLKQKEQRLERLRLEEAENAKKRQFKARPVRLSQAPVLVVKPTAASRARMSLLHPDATESSSNDHAPRIKPLVRVSTVGAESKRTSSLDVARKRPSITTTTTTTTAAGVVTASSTAMRGSSLTNTSAPRTSSLTAAAISTSRHPSTTSKPLNKGKEVFQRERVELEEREKAKREKEEAARKARVEAAERGRLASREWAEKMRARKEGGKMGGVKGEKEEGEVQAKMGKAEKGEVGKREKRGIGKGEQKGKSGEAKGQKKSEGEKGEGKAEKVDGEKGEGEKSEKLDEMKIAP